MKKNEIVWEDEDTGFDDITDESKRDQSDEFANLLENNSVDQSYYEKGSQVTGKVSKIPDGDGYVVIELDQSTDAIMAKSEFLQNYPTSSLGDEIIAYFTSYVDGAIILEHSLSAGANARNSLQSAYENKTPVKGKVEASNKGGFEVTVLGKKAFCPISQISNHYVEKTDEYIGKTFEFIITEFSNKNLTVSRKDFLRIQEKETVKRLELTYDSSPLAKGKIVEIKDFGVVIDVEGVRGFCHISEISRRRLNHPSEKLELNQDVSVKILELDSSSDKVKLSLSIKQAEKDPWDDISALFKEGDSLTGVVTRLEDFGAFVEIGSELEGLIHISEMSWVKRVHHPKDVLSPGDKVNIRVLAIDSLKQRISLTMKSIESDPWANLETKYRLKSEHFAQVVSLKSFGAFAELEDGITGFLPLKLLQKVYGPRYRKEASPPKKLKVFISAINHEERKILLGLSGQEDETQSFDFTSYETPATELKSEKSTGAFGEILGQALKKKSK